MIISIKPNTTLTNRYNNPKLNEKINNIILDFPYLRYSVLYDKFRIYRGKVLGEKSYAESVINFKHYVAEWSGEWIGEHSVKPFSIESFLLCPPPKADSFENYLIKSGWDTDKYLSKEEQDELLTFISDTLMLRKEKSKAEKYKSSEKTTNYRLFSLIW